MENSATNKKYTDIEQVKENIESLGDWKDPAQRDSYLEALSKIISIYNGYELESKQEDGKKSKKREYYPNEVIKAIADICSKKFPADEEVFENGEVKPGLPDDLFSNYLVMARTAEGISLLGERSSIDIIAMKKFDMDVYHTPMTEEEVKRLIESSKKYLEQEKEQEVQKISKLAEKRHEIKEEIATIEEKNTRENDEDMEK